MPFQYRLSVAGITFQLDTVIPLVQNKEFTPFLTQSADIDVHAVFRPIEKLPPLPQSLLFSGLAYRDALDDQENPQRFFYETAQDPVHYAVSTLKSGGREIQVDYLESYSRCVSELRNCFVHLGLEAILLYRSKLCLHATCVDTPLGGILFSGVSGIGKSTQAELWCKHRGARQINGDRPILSKEGKSWQAWGSPYAGSSKCHVNDSCAVSAIVLLDQAETCSLRRLGTAEAFRGVWAGLTVRSWDSAFVETASLLTVDLVTSVPVYAFSCTPDEQAVSFLEQELRKEHHV